ncbi:MAG: extracellular solute-binding protein [Phycisphaerales bacterium]
MSRLLVILALVFLIGLPLVMRRDEQRTFARDARRLIVLSPHNEQIRFEFGRAFSDWHERRYGEPVEVIWNTPGGTSDIRRMLVSQYRAALRDGRPIGGNADLLFGGGSYEFTELKKPIEVEVRAGDGLEKRTTTVLAPIDFDDAFLRGVYGDENRIGDDPLYDPDRYWFGAALSGFGILYNRDVLDELGVPAPSQWRNLADPRLIGAVSLVNPAQSGSIATAFEAILLRRGWTDGWRILRRVAANARSFSASSARGPIDVAQGDAAAGICIDFYGRYEAQAILDAGGGDRLGYVDPPGETRIDADPVAMLRGAPEPEIAKRFIEFALSLDGQALWQFTPRSALAGIAGDNRGPERYELRRMPIRREMFEPGLLERMIDRVNPYLLATAVEKPDRNVRTFIVPIFGAMAIDEHDLLREAWRAIVSHPAYPRDGLGGRGAPAAAPDGAPAVVTAADVTDPTLREMLTLFDAMPQVQGPDGAMLTLADTTQLATIRDGWIKEQWIERRLWPAQALPSDELRRQFREFFRENYRRIVRLTSVPVASGAPANPIPP